MKKTITTYLLFICAMSLFVTLRIYAGRAVSAQQMPVAENADAAGGDDTASEVTADADAAEPEDTPEEDIREKLQVSEDEEKLWRGESDPVSDFNGYLPRIVCWGDSLTVSIDGKSAFPDVLRSLSGCEVINYGVEAESTSMIAMREGGLRVNVKATVIPADTNLIPVFLRTENNGHVHFLDHGDGGVNPCSIGGIEGELQKLNGSYYFKRMTKGERIAIEEGTRFETFGMKDAKEGDVLVIFAGTNDLPDSKSVGNIITLEKQMLEAAHCDKYIIVGLTYAGGIPEIDEVNRALEKEFGDHFVDIRRYMLTYGLEDAGIKPTSADKADIAIGEIPGSLRRDYVHGNSIYHKLLGEQVYRRMVYLGYCK